MRGTTESFVDEQGKVYWEVEGTGLVTPSVLTMRIVPTESITGVDALTMVTTQDSETPGVAPTPDPTAAPTASPEPSATAESEG